MFVIGHMYSVAEKARQIGGTCMLAFRTLHAI